MNEKCVDCEGRGLPNNALPGIKTQCLHFQKLAKLPNIHIRAGAGSNNFKTLNLLILGIICEWNTKKIEIQGMPVYKI